MHNQFVKFGEKLASVASFPGHFSATFLRATLKWQEWPGDEARSWVQDAMCVVQQIHVFCGYERHIQ